MSELETKLEKIHNLYRCDESQHSWQSARTLARQKRLLNATTKPLTGRWVDTMHDDGARKARWTTRGYEQTLNGNEDSFSATPAMMHLKMMLVEAALKGHVAAIGDCSGAFSQSPLNLDGTESQVWIEPPPEAELGPDYIREAVSAFPGLKGAPRAWDTYSAKVLTNSMQMEQSQYDGCLFYRFEPSQERIEEKAGRHIDDFLVTGPEPNVERFLEQARGKLNMQDAVRLYKTGDEGRLLAMNLRKLNNGYSLQGKPLLIHRIATTLGMENAKTSLIPETINEKAQDGDEESLTPSETSGHALVKQCTSVITSRHSAQREHTFQINEESDGDSNAKAQEAYPLFAWHE